jgi:phage terminase small subunit
MGSPPVSPLDDELNAREVMFCYEYVSNGFNMLQALKDAGYSAGKDGMNGSQATELYNRPKVQRKIKELLDAHLTPLQISAEKIIRELVAVGFSDIRNYVAENGTEVTVKTLNDFGHAAKAIQQLEVVNSSIPGERARVKIKLYDKIKSLELLGKNLQMFVEKLDVKHSISDQFDEAATAAYKARLAKIKADLDADKSGSS